MKKLKFYFHVLYSGVVKLKWHSDKMMDDLVKMMD